MHEATVDPDPTHGSAGRAVGAQGVWGWFVVDCLLATAVRLGLAWWTGGYRTDVLTFESWADTLRREPISRFYATSTGPDHLPGDLWILKATEWIFTLAGGRDVYGRGFAFLIQVVPTLGDLLTAVMVLLIARRYADPATAGRCARWYLLNPATIVITGVWGQWDSVSLGVMLTGVWLSLHRRLWVASAPFFVWAILIKPQLGLPIICYLVVLGVRLRGPSGRRWVSMSTRRAVIGVLTWTAAGAATGYALLTPFNVHLGRAPAGGSTLADRLHSALGLYPYTTVGAANVWMLSIRSLRRVRDDAAGWWGLTPQQWGVVLLGVALLSIAITWSMRLRRVDPVVGGSWAATMASLAAFLFSTRVHERYALPVLGIGLLLVAMEGFDRRLTRGFWLLSACFTLNLALVLFGGVRGPGGDRLSFGSAWWAAVAAGYCLLSLGLLAWPWVRRPHAEPGARSST